MLGLDNAGKTSIVKLAVDKILTPLQVPTKGAERKEIDLLGQKVVVQDLGGQKKYRIQYMENPAFFDATDTLVFVVDLQDKDRYELAGEYFNDSLDMLDELAIFPDIFVFFHKFDGFYLEDYKDYSTRVPMEFSQLKESFQQAAKQHGRTIEDVYQTSVRDEWGCFLAFTRVWTSTVPRTASLQQFVDTLVGENQEITVALVVDSKNNLLSKAFRIQGGIDPEAMVNMAARSVLTLLDWQENIQHQSVPLTDFAIVEMGDQSIMIQKIHVSGGDSIYLLVLAIGGAYKELQARFANIAFSLENIL